MKLYFSPGACSLAPHIVAAEAGSAVALEKVDLGKQTTASGLDYRKINPKGQVPCLQFDDGSTLTEGPVIAQYLADQAKSTSLMPAAGTMARYRVMEWQNFITSELHKGFSPLFNPKYDAAAKSVMKAGLRQKFEWVDTRLAGRSYLTGDDFTCADAYLFTVANWAGHVQLELSDLAHLKAFMGRVAARPAVVRAMKEEGLLR